MKRINIYLGDEHYEELFKLSELGGAPVAELVRRAVDQYLKRTRAKSTSQSAAASDPHAKLISEMTFEELRTNLLSDDAFKKNLLKEWIR